MKVYLDHAATAPIKREVREAILPFLKNKFGNPSSIHQWGQEARQAVDRAREQVAKFLNTESSEIIFTSGGTEADNLAIRGLIAQISKSAFRHSFLISKQIPFRHANSKFKIQKPHIITTQIEHHAILKTCEHLEKTGQAEVTYLKPNREGLISVEQVKNAIKKNTVLISIMYVNNELGTIQPIREIGKMIEKENRNWLKENGRELRKQKMENSKNSNFQYPISKPISNFHQPFSKIYFHTDAVQATEYLPMDVDWLHIDLLTLSGHKIGAPKGIGALYVCKNTPLQKIIFGGEQEMNLRSGTENVAGIVALGKAVQIVGRRKTENGRRIQELRDYFIDRVLKEIPEVELNGSKKLRSPNNANFYFAYIEGESILLNLDLAGIAASSGSACTSQSLTPSHVITATFDSAERAHGSVRFTLGENTTYKEIDYVVQNLKKIVKRLRDMSPLAKKGYNG